MIRLLLFLVVCGRGFAATFYVDSAAGGSNNGTSWANAWTAISSATGANVSAGDTVYISGGTLGGAGKSYASFNPKSGSSGNPITYKIGQDTGHNGVVTFTGTGTWISAAKSNLIVSGDAGDGDMHFAMSGYSTHVGNGLTNVRLSYINFGTAVGDSAGRLIECLSGNGIEIDHCFAKGNATGLNTDIVWYIESTGTPTDYTYGLHLHHNELWAPRGSGGGQDGLRFTGTGGNSIHHNLIISYDNGTSSGEHQDGMQDWTGGQSYIKIYNNRVYDFLNASILVSAFDGGYTDVYIFNNIVGFSNSTAEAQNQGGGVGIAGSGLTFTRCVVANNIIVGGSQTWWLNNSGNVSATWTNCKLVNNITVQATGVDADTAHGVTSLTNVNNMSSGTAGTSFVQYDGVLGKDTNNLHLLAGATGLIGQGTDLTSLGIAELNVDFDGNARPNGSAWDIGPYQYSAGGGGSSGSTSLSGSGTSSFSGSGTTTFQ